MQMSHDMTMISPTASLDRAGRDRQRNVGQIMRKPDGKIMIRVDGAFEKVFVGVKSGNKVDDKSAVFSKSHK